MIAHYPSPGGGEEYALSIDRGRTRRLVILPALFDEANKLRHFTVQTMRALDAAGFDSVLPDLPGCNESLAPLETQTLAGWRHAAQAAASYFKADVAVSIRGGALCVPDGLTGLHYAPTSGVAVMRGLLRARIVAAQEAGQNERREHLLELGRHEGLVLSGYKLGATMIRELEAANEFGPADATIAQEQLGGPGLWLRAEPASDPAQATALAQLIGQVLA